MLKKILFVLFIFSQLKSFTQQCGYDFYYLFVVNVHTKNSNEKIPNLKMYLVDENEKPFTADVSYNENAGKKYGDEHGKWKHKTDTLFFWENDKAKKGFGERTLLRQKFYRVGDYYIVAFHLKGSEVRDPEKYPLYKLKIEQNNSQLNSINIPTQTFNLPLGKAVNICHNHLYDDFHYLQSVTSYDNQPFKPIDIILNETTENFGLVVEEPKNELQYTVRFNYRTITDISENDKYILDEAKVYNTQTGKLHQEIYIPRISKSYAKESKNIVDFIDFYDRDIKEAKDFSVQIDTWRDLDNKVIREKTNFYIFNTQTKKYELDEILSSDNDVFYYAPLKKMRRYDYETNATAKIIYTYQLENKKWVLIDKNETLFKPKPESRKLTVKECIYIKENSHTLPIKAVIGTNAKVIIIDTLWVYNTCNDTINISKVQSATRDFFSINQTLLPHSKNPLIFNGTLIGNSFDFITKNFDCMLTFSDGYMLGLGVYIPTISNNATVYYNADSTINYAIANPYNSRFAAAIFTFPDGKLRAKGTVQDKDTTIKVGKWDYYKQDTWGLDEKVYSKSVTLSTINESYYNNRIKFKINVLEHNEWKEPIIETVSYGLRFYINPETDSIKAFTDTTNYTFALPYNKLPNDIIKQVYLLKPNEPTLVVNGIRVPFYYFDNEIDLKFQYHYFKGVYPTKVFDVYFEKLVKQFPTIKSVVISEHTDNFKMRRNVTTVKGINIGTLNTKEKKLFFDYLSQDTTIAFVSHYFAIGQKNSKITCNNQVYVELSINDISDFKEAAKKLGFTSIRPDMGNNKYFLTYKSKLLNKEFFEAFEKLTEESKVVMAGLNPYMQNVTLD